MTRLGKTIAGVCLVWHAATLLLVNLATVAPTHRALAAMCQRWPFRQWAAITGTAGGYGFFAPGVSSPFRLVCGGVTVIGPTGIREAALLDRLQALLPAEAEPDPQREGASLHAAALARRLAADWAAGDTLVRGSCHVQVLYLPRLGSAKEASRWLTVYSF